MPKVLSELARASVLAQTGEKPVLLVAINWGLGINWYASRDIQLPDQFAPGVITSFGDINCEKRADNLGTVSTASLEFHDRDGLFKTRFDITDLEGTPCSIFLGFADKTTQDAVPLLFGKMVGPFSWDERTKKVRFEVESELIDNEIGFSATSDDFADIYPDSEDVPWPMIFGTCSHVPALMVRKHTEGYLQYPIRLKGPIYKNISFTVGGQGFTKPILTNNGLNVRTVTTGETNKIYIRGGENFPRNKDIQISVAGVIFKGQFNNDTTPELFIVQESNLPKYQNIKIVDAPSDTPADFKQNIFLDDAFQGSLANHHCYFNTKTPEGFYNYCTSQTGQEAVFKYKFLDPVSLSEVKDHMTGRQVVEVYAISKAGILGEYIEKINRMGRTYGLRHKEQTVTKYLDTLKENSNVFWTASDDTPVRLWDTQDPDIYAVSAVPCAEVVSVSAYRSVDLNDGRGKIKVLSQIPSEWYEVQLESNYAVNGAKVTGLIFQIPFEDRDLTQEWEDQLYVTARSTIGPNTANIIKYLLQTYSTLAVDLGDTVNDLENYPSHFSIFDRKNVIRACQEIAWQARCVLIIDSGVAFLKYLAKQPDSLLVVTKAEIDYEDSFTLETTQSSDVITKLVGTWADTYKYISGLTRFHESEAVKIMEVVRSMSTDSKRREKKKKVVVYRNNVDKYGIRSRTEDIYIYTDEDSVRRTIEFWGYRFSSSWKVVTFRTMLPALQTQAFDGVALTLDDINILPNCLGIIESISFNYARLSVGIKLWLPIRVGTNFQDNGVFPDA